MNYWAISRTPRKLFIVPQSFLPLLPFIWAVPELIHALMRMVVAEAVPAGMTASSFAWQTYVYHEPGEQLVQEVFVPADANALVEPSLNAETTKWSLELLSSE